MAEIIQFSCRVIFTLYYWLIYILINNFVIDIYVQACGHRYIYYVFMFRKDPVGSCFIATKNFTQFHQMRPCVETGRERPGAGAVPPRICLFFLSYSRNHLFSCIICMCRRVPQDTSGIRVTINDESPSVLASLLKIIWKNFLSIRRVRQVSPK